MSQRQVHPTTDNTKTEGELNYQQRKLKRNKVRPSNIEYQKNNSFETSSKPEKENPEDPDKVEPLQRIHKIPRHQKDFLPYE